MKQNNNFNPFHNLVISSHEPLLGAVREKCIQCNSFVKYYCPICIKLVPSIDSTRIPKLVLPIEIFIWKHPSESIYKCTSVHALLLSSSQVSLINHHPIFDPVENLLLKIPHNSLVIYPDPNSPFINQVDIGSYSGVIFLEATWPQSSTMMSTLLSALPTIRIARLDSDTLPFSNGSLFWRYQKKGQYCLSTIEAIYLLCKQIDPARSYDNLLYFFAFFYLLIQNQYINNGIEYSSKHRLGKAYITKS